MSTILENEQFEKLVSEVKAELLSQSQGVGDVEVVDSLDGINSLPSLKNGNQVVEAPLSLLSAPATEAAEKAYEAIENANDTASHPTYIGEDNYVYVWNKSNQTYDKTNIYVRGEGFKISKTYPSIADMEADSTHGLKEGDFVLINTNDVENPDNAKIYVVNKEGTFHFLVDMSGAIGFTGKTPQISIGIITTGVGRGDASATLTDDGFDEDGNPRYKLNIKIPSIRLSDLDEVEIAMLQQPANDMIAELNQTNSNVQEAEKGRIASENTRKANEDTRLANETQRQSNEQERQEQSNVIKNNEDERIASEETRNENESTRQANETTRQNQERSREQLKSEMEALNQELKDNPPRITSEGNWEVWDALNKVYIDTGKMALGKTPIIQNGNWWIFDDDSDAYVDTGISVSSDYELKRENVESVLGGIPAFYVEEWKHTDVPFRSGAIVKFNQEFYSALKDTSVPPVPLLLLGEGIIAKVDEHTYATKGSYDAEGNKDDWKKIPYDELRLSSRYGTLNGEEVDVRTLATPEEVYQLEPNLYIDLLRGILKAKKVDFPNLPKKNVTDALGYVPLSEARIDQLFDEDALDVLQGSDVLAIESNGKKATVTVDMLKSFFNAHDLSRHDIYGNAIKQTTANCYVVKEKGYYSFPLVYGNALKDGEVNTPAFTKVEGTYSMDFVNHLDNVITSPYIEQHEGCQPVSVELSLCDTKDVFGKFKIVKYDDCSYVEFEVINVPKTGANGVVSIIDANGDAIWSWHIWLWEDDLTPVTITNATNVNYDILPVNLASKWDEDSKTHIKNWFYQWGRHIPMLSPSAYNSTTDAANYGKRAFGKVSKAASYGVGLKSPWNFYTNANSPYNWFGSKNYYNLWDASCLAIGASDNNVVKTIYDPSPIGYKAANGKAFTGFSVISQANGICRLTRYNGDVTGVKFNLSGYRYCGEGTIHNVNSYGYSWESAIHDERYARCLYFTSASVTPEGSSQYAHGYPIRPIKE